MMKDIEFFIMLFTGSKNIDFSRRYVPKKLVFWPIPPTGPGRLGRVRSKKLAQSPPYRPYSIGL